MVTKKENTPSREARRRYEEKNKDKRQAASGNFQTMIPRDKYEEITAFLKANNITKVQLIYAGYNALLSAQQPKQDK